MLSDKTYYVIAPIDGLRLNFDYRMYSAEIYGCPPDYTSDPDACPEFRQPYEYLCDSSLKNLKNWEIDDQTFQIVTQIPNLNIKDSTCIAFELDVSKVSYDFSNDNILFQQIIDKGEEFLDPWRLCLFKPGDSRSIGKFGGVIGGIQCFWLGQHNIQPRFIARKTSRYDLVQSPITVRLSEFGPIYSDLTFRGLCVAAFFYPENNDEIINRIFSTLRAFRESRDIQSPEARFRQLAAITESLANKTPDERLKGFELRKRIAKISSSGWRIYTKYNNSVFGALNLLPSQHKLINKRYSEIGWQHDNQAEVVVKELWDRVRNPLSHTVNTFAYLGRNPGDDLENMERIVVTMINGLHTAYELEDLYGKSLFDILLDIHDPDVT
jgi:hypothetical protein